MQDETSVGEAARLLDTSVEKMQYRVRRLLALRLIKLDHERKRGGRPVKYYRAVATSFFVPFAVTTAASLEELLIRADEELRAPFVRSLARAFDTSGWGLRLTADDNGELSGKWAPEAAEDYSLTAELQNTDAPAVVFASAQLRLDLNEAKTIQRELWALLGRYSSANGSAHYIIRLAFAPYPD